MKDLCRAFDIVRWPYRKLSSLDSLLHDLDANIEAFPEQAHGLLVIKNKILNNKAEIMEEPNTPIDESVHNLRQTNFKNKYKQRLLAGYKTGK
eukprot:gene13994-19928_t